MERAAHAIELEISTRFNALETVTIHVYKFHEAIYAFKLPLNALRKSVRRTSSRRCISAKAT